MSRTVYFRLINKDAKIWGQYIIRDKDGKIIAGEGGAENQGPILAEANGHCMDFEKEPSPHPLFSFQECGSVDFLSIASKMTLGEEKTKFVGDELPIAKMNFVDAPKDGVRTK